jgi:hypothetical protein
MDTAITLALTAAWLALGALLAYHVFDAWRRVEPLPFCQLLERHGLSVAQAEKAAGREALATALQRCAQCSEKKDCSLTLAVYWHGRQPLACGPNAGFLEQVRSSEPRHA